MDIRVLQYFLAVAREESISRAAECLHMSQPPLSRQMKELEEELGVQLLIRGSRKVTLTPEGQILRKRAEELVSLMHKTEKEIRSPDDSLSGDIYIGAGETEAMGKLAKVAKALQAEHPGIHYNIISGDAKEVTEQLDKGLLDFGVLLDPVDLTKYDSLPIPAKDTFGVLMRKDSPLAARKTVTAEDLRSLPLLVSRQTLDGGGLYALLQCTEQELNIVATYTLIYNASLLVAEGFGYALCLDKLINTHGSDLCFRPLSPANEIGMRLVWKRNQLFSRPAFLFLSALQNAWNQNTL